MPGPRPYIDIDFLMLPGAERLGISAGILPALAVFTNGYCGEMREGSISTEMSHVGLTRSWRELIEFGLGLSFAFLSLER